MHMSRMSSMSTKECETVLIECSPGVTDDKIHESITKYDDGCSTFRDVMEKARSIVISKKAKGSDLKNFKIKCYCCDHYILVFWTGDTEKELVVESVAGKIVVKTIPENWLERCKEVIKGNKTAISFCIVYVAAGAFGVPFPDQVPGVF